MIIWLALFLLVLIGFGSLSVDVAKLAATRTQLQNAADAAALAGASAIDPETGVIVQPTATGRAQTVGDQQQGIHRRAAAGGARRADVTFPAWNKIRVKVRREGANGVVTTLAQVVGPQEARGDGDRDRQDRHAQHRAVRDPAARRVADGQQSVPRRMPVHLHAQVGLGRGGGGQYGAVNFPQCLDRGDCAGMSPNGANTFRCLMKYGYCCPIKIGDVLKTESGNMAGPTKQAIDYRFEHRCLQRSGHLLHRIPRPRGHRPARGRDPDHDSGSQPCDGDRARLLRVLLKTRVGYGSGWLAPGRVPLQGHSRHRFRKRRGERRHRLRPAPRPQLVSPRSAS
jgi:hypothetical protein